MSPPLLSLTQWRAFDLLQEGIWIADVADCLVYLNPAMARFAGVPVDSLLGRCVLEFATATIDQFRPFFLAAREALAPMPYECELTTPGGCRTWQSGWLTPLLTDGIYQGMLCSVQDITATMDLKASMLNARQQLELVLAGADLGTWNWHLPSGRVVFNQRWSEMLGYRLEEIVPDIGSWKKLAHPDDWHDINTQLEAHLRGDTPAYESEHRLRHKQGHWVWVLDRGKVVERDPANQPLRVAGTLLDISDRKRLKTEGAALLRRIEALIGGAAASPRPVAAGHAATQLTTRQRRVLGLIANGQTSSQIATQLHISTATAATHRRDLMRKLGLHSTADLTRYAIEHGLDR